MHAENCHRYVIGADCSLKRGGYSSARYSRKIVYWIPGIFFDRPVEVQHCIVIVAMYSTCGVAELWRNCVICTEGVSCGVRDQLVLLLCAYGDNSGQKMRHVTKSDCDQTPTSNCDHTPATICEKMRTRATSRCSLIHSLLSLLALLSLRFSLYCVAHAPAATTTATAAHAYFVLKLNLSCGSYSKDSKIVLGSRYGSPRSWCVVWSLTNHKAMSASSNKPSLRRIDMKQCD